MSIDFNKVAQEIRDHVDAISPVEPTDRLEAAKPVQPKTDLSQAQFDDTANLWRLTDPLGYVRLYQDQPTPRNYFKYDYEHRRVLAEALGRELLRQEIIHHLDGNKANNTLENLQLIEDHLAHMKLHPEWRKRR